MKEKFFYLPEAENNLPGEIQPDPQPPEPEGKYPCPCCSCITFPVPWEEAVAFICPVCFWENDLFLSREDEPSDENHGLTLAQADRLYTIARASGTSDPEMDELYRLADEWP